MQPNFFSFRFFTQVGPRRLGLVGCGSLLGIMGALVPNPAALRAEAVQEVLLCGYRVPLSAQWRWELLQNDAELLVLRSQERAQDRSPLSAQWLLSCQPNAERTSRVGEIRGDARERGHSVHQLLERTLDREIEAAVFSRTRVHEGRRIKSIEAYFATRELEYRLFALPLRRPDGQIPARAYDQLMREMNTMLDTGSFAGPVEPTIRESVYQMRLYLAGFVLAIVSLAALCLAIRVVLPTGRSKSPEGAS